MTISGWIVFIAFAVCVLLVGFLIILTQGRVFMQIVTGIVSVSVVVGLYFGMAWYFGNTASGQRAMVDQKSNFSNGIERTITIFTADGEIIAQYSGKIDMRRLNNGYTKS